MNKGYLFDTDVLISFLRGKNKSLKLYIQDLMDKEVTICMSIISLGELYLGAFKSDNPPKNLFLVNKLKGTLDLIGLDNDIILLYGEIEALLEKAGMMIGDFDVLIASTAISKNLTLASGNQKHFQRIQKVFGQLNFEKLEIL